ncbi:MAG: BREX-1 system phosphatase PglZ type A, partial [Bacteroidota bacterium]
MDIDQIRGTLERIFNEPGVRVIFWNDPGAEFQADLSAAIPERVELVRLNETSALEVKIRIERLLPDTQFLIYSPAEEPPFDDDWLLDIRLYGRSFRADRASILLNELGLGLRQSLREYIAERRKFFESKERTQRLKGLVVSDDDQFTLDLKMLAVVVRAEQPEPFTVVRALFHGFIDQHADADVGHLEAPPPAWREVERLDLAAPFWRMVEAQFGYSEETPSLRNLLIRILVSDFAYRLRGKLPTSLEHLLLSPTGRANAAVCLANWRDSSRFSSSYDALSNEVAGIIDLEHYLHTP